MHSVFSYHHKHHTIIKSTKQN